MLAMKHNIVASTTQMKLGGSTYPVPPQVIETPKPEGRVISANTKRITATITNISVAFISPPRMLVCADDLIDATGRGWRKINYAHPMREDVKRKHFSHSSP